MTEVFYGVKDRFNNGFNFVDMHIHTRASDGTMEPEEVVRKCKELKIGFAVTDHNEIESSLKCLDKGIFCVPGIEVTSIENHDVLFYFKDRKLLEDFYLKYIVGRRVNHWVLNFNKTNYKLNELIKISRDYDTLSVLAHPHCPWPKRSKGFVLRKNLIDKFDAVEGINHFMSKRMNMKTISMARKFNKPMIAGSDAHHLKYVGSALTGCRANSVKKFLEEVRAGNNIIIGDSVNVLAASLQSVELMIKDSPLFK